MYSILKIYIEVYVHVLNVHLTNCLFLWVSLCIILLLYIIGKIDQIVHINLAYKVLLMLFTSHCDCYTSVDKSEHPNDLIVRWTIMQKDHRSVSISQ